MITPSIGLALWARRGLWPPPTPGAKPALSPQSDPAVIETLTRTLGRIQGYEHLGLEDEVRRELEALPIAIRELPAEAINEVKKLVESAKSANQDEKALEHVER